jgi:multicomponent Na+:H+ antiporter subunit D
MEIFSRPLISVLYREKIVSFITYSYTAIIIVFGIAFRLLDMPLNMAIKSIFDIEKYIHLVLGG